MDRGFLKKLSEDFLSPGSAYRGKPFWAWNGELEPEELRRQIRILKRMGLGGFFMHSRVGLATPYLSEEWFDCIAACVDEAKKQKMEAWLYDEDRWPSGAAGGFVTKNPRYRMRSLTLSHVDRLAEILWDQATIAVFTAKSRGAFLIDSRRITKQTMPKSLERGERILIFRETLQEPHSWYNGYTYLDTLNPEAVKAFIETTHEAYRKRFSPHFGTLIPGIFTDEPNYGRAFAPSVVGPDMRSLPWTGSLPKTFKERYGYDIRNRIPELFFDVKGAHFFQARYHFFDCITHLFTQSFGKQIGEWCEKNGLLSTGHVLLEETLHTQTSVVGSCMRFYEFMQAPGMDILTEHKREYDTAKQVSSAAHQFGSKWRLSETYGCTGWDFPFTGHKAVGDWQTALGINLRCPHLSLYTMEGEAKRDYPASIFYQSPWWELYSKVEDYYSRVHAVMTRGEEVRDLLVIHPVESMWLHFHQGWMRGGAPEPAVADFSKGLMDLRDTLLAGNIDFDYGDEEILSRHARIIRRGKKAAFVVGKASYKAVLVPSMKTMRASTIALLESFLDAGGHVAFAGPAPKLVDALPSAAAEDLARRCFQADAAGSGVLKAVELFCRRISVKDQRGREIGPILHLLREDRDAFYLFLCNVGYEFRGKGLEDIPARDRRLEFPTVTVKGFESCEGHPLELQPEDGKIFRADALKQDGAWEIRTAFSAIASRLFVIPKREKVSAPRRRQSGGSRTQAMGGRKWQIVLSEDNVLVLDRPKCAIGAGRAAEPEEVLRVDRRIRKYLGLPYRGGRMAQPWILKTGKPDKNAKTTEGVPIHLSYSFGVKAVPSGSLFLGLEQPDRYTAKLNGFSIDTSLECGWWVDRSLRKLPLDSSFLRRGSNELALECVYDSAHPGLECVYLLGSFGVELDGTVAQLTAMPVALNLGDWVAQGLPFYAGSVTYRRALVVNRTARQRVFLEVPEYRGVAVRIFVDGSSAGIIAWPPNEVDITDYLPLETRKKSSGGKKQENTPKEHEIGIQIIGHRRNSHGPLHHSEKWPDWTGPVQFITEGNEWIETYQLVPCGMMRSPRLIVRE